MSHPEGPRFHQRGEDPASFATSVVLKLRLPNSSLNERQAEIDGESKNARRTQR
jgi:hypothetical protein